MAALTRNLLQLRRRANKGAVTLHEVDVAHIADHHVGVAESQFATCCLPPFAIGAEDLDIYSREKGKQSLTKKQRPWMRSGHRHAGAHYGVGPRKYEGHHRKAQWHGGKRVKKLPYDRHSLESRR
jgi:hypothetical protein